MVPIRLIMIDDHQLLTDTWTLMLNRDPRFKVISTTNSSKDAVSFVEEHHPDIVLMDIAITPMDGIELTKSLQSLVPRPRVIAFSLYSMPGRVKQMMDAGARGYVTKNSPKEELFQAIIDVNKGLKYICQEVKDKLSQEEFETDEITIALNRLTPRELSIIQHLKNGFTSREIGIDLGISKKTVEIHRYNILKKLRVRNVASLINVINMRGVC
jgi:DNA-binding NarL/FixJ family response regulator